MTFDSIIFDLDGTLWDSTDVVTHAWNSTIRQYPGLGEITPAQMESVTGLPIEEITRRLFPEADEHRHRELAEECGKAEASFLAVSGGKLFPALEETLRELSRTYPLFIVSNCQSGYIEAFFQAHGLQRYFTDYECPGNTGLSKGENIRLVMQRNGLQCPVYVGDTQGDYNASRFAETEFIHAEYGFGTVQQLTLHISAISHLPQLLQELAAL